MPDYRLVYAYNTSGGENTPIGHVTYLCEPTCTTYCCVHAVWAQKCFCFKKSMPVYLYGPAPEIKWSVLWML
jgi:hypothetical protein